MLDLVVVLESHVTPMRHLNLPYCDIEAGKRVVVLRVNRQGRERAETYNITLTRGYYPTPTTNSDWKSGTISNTTFIRGVLTRPPPVYPCKGPKLGCCPILRRG